MGLISQAELKGHKCPARNPISTAEISFVNRSKLQRQKKNFDKPGTVVMIEEKGNLFVKNDSNNKVLTLDEIDPNANGGDDLCDDEEQVTVEAGGLNALADAAAKHQNSCEFCGKLFGTPGGRHKHLKLKHGYKRLIKGKTPTSCSLCDQVFKNVFLLKNHIRAVHTGIIA
jgi:hypothetical protein